MTYELIEDNVKVIKENIIEIIEYYKGLSTVSDRYTEQKAVEKRNKWQYLLFVVEEELKELNKI
jgi:hypothetical protein